MFDWLERLKDIAWPRTCEVCGHSVDRPARYLCSDCLMRLPVIEQNGLCRVCGREAVGLDGEFLCEECARRRPGFDRVATAFRFDGDARKLVNAFKFSERLHLRADFVDWLEGAVRARMKVDKIDCVVPMPSTVAHRWLRGYNQCAYLAEDLAKRLGKPCCSLLRRVGSPKRQGGLDEEERRKNVRGTFLVTRTLARMRPKRVLLVDDILTTGSTLDEAARTLKASGVTTVFAATLARSMRV